MQVLVIAGSERNGSESRKEGRNQWARGRKRTNESRVGPRLVGVGGSLAVGLLDESEKVGALLGRSGRLDEALRNGPRVEIAIGPGRVDVVLRVCNVGGETGRVSQMYGKEKTDRDEPSNL